MKASITNGPQSEARGSARPPKTPLFARFKSKRPPLPPKKKVQKDSAKSKLDSSCCDDKGKEGLSAARPSTTLPALAGLSIPGRHGAGKEGLGLSIEIEGRRSVGIAPKDSAPAKQNKHQLELQKKLQDMKRCESEPGQDGIWNQYMTDMNYFDFMERTKHRKDYQERQFKLKAARKAQLARKAFKLGVNRVKEMVKNKEKLQQFKQALDQKQE